MVPLPCLHASVRACMHPCVHACMQAGIITSCKENQVRRLAQDGAQRQLGAAAFAQYEYLQYIMPKGANKHCE